METLRLNIIVVASQGVEKDKELIIRTLRVMSEIIS